jgi:XRE family aerobic/anaerobic benzoate catabolism transcriptional regulator
VFQKAQNPGQMLGIQVGRKVKTLRRDRALTRKQLAERASISERYIGQLENGQANVSLNVLDRIVVELSARITDVLPGASKEISHDPLRRLLEELDGEELEKAFKLLSSNFGVKPHPRKGIALVGLRGAGKTTLGRELSGVSGIPFKRLTGMIADEAGMTMAELIELGGTNGLRRLEREVLNGLVEEPGPVILETSGGIVANRETYDHMRAHFVTVWVKAAPEEHMQRVIDQNDLRPISGRSSAMLDLKSLLLEREGAYAEADFVLDTSGRGKKDCLGELVEIAGEMLTAPTG